MNDTIVTVVGNVVDSPRRVRLENGSVTNFRMASTARRYDAARQEFVDGGTFWVDVECWGDLGANVSSSVSKGDPVILQGALTTHSWETEAGRRSSPRIRAFAVGPNLARGSSVFRRTAPPRTAQPDEAETSAAAGEEAFPSTGDRPVAGVDYEAPPETLSREDSDEQVREPALR